MDQLFTEEIYGLQIFKSSSLSANGNPVIQKLPLKYQIIFLHGTTDKDTMTKLSIYSIKINFRLIFNWQSFAPLFFFFFFL